MPYKDGQIIKPLVQWVQGHCKQLWKQHFGKPRKIRRVSYLNEENNRKRKEFCNFILKIKIRPEQIFFTDISKMDLGSFKHDSYCLDPKIEWNEDA